MSHHWYTHKPKMILPVLDPPATPPAPFPRVLPPRPAVSPLVSPERSVMSAALEVCPVCGVGWRHGALERCWYCQPA